MNRILRGASACGLVLAACATPLAAAPKLDYKWVLESPHYIDLHFDKEQLALFRAADPELLRLTPVVNSIDHRYQKGEDIVDALGYSVGGYDGHAIYIAYFARTSHWGGEDNEHPEGVSSRCSIVRSLDDGFSWSDPLPTDRMLDGFGYDRSQIGWGLSVWAENDRTLVLSKTGIYETYDHGESWKRLKSAFSREDFPRIPFGDNKYHLGPVVFRHPVGGLITFAHIWRIHKAMGGFWILHSLDEGETWEATHVLTGNMEVTPVEPTACMYGEGADARFFMFTRNGLNGQGSNPATLFIDVLSPGEYEITHAQLTNCEVGGHQDTHDVIYNPRTDCFESVVTNRGTPGEVRHDYYDLMELTLWSIPREEAEAGSARWQYRGHLLNPIRQPLSQAEGSHPGGSFIHNGYHYIPFHRGDHPSTRSSVYLLRRSLDTDAVSKILKHYDSHRTD